MAGQIIRRKITTYRWICTDKDRCEQLDASIAEIEREMAKLSYYVANKEITGLQCLAIGPKLRLVVKELRDERKTLWRRVPKVVEEDIEQVDEHVAAVGPAPEPLVRIQHIGGH